MTPQTPTAHTLSRDCASIRIPSGEPVNLPAGTSVYLTQSLGGTFTVQAPSLGGLFRIAGSDAMKFAGWQRLNAEYAKQFGVELPSWPSRQA